MLKKSNEIQTMEEICPEGGRGRLELTDLFSCFGKNTKISTFAYAKLDAGSDVGYHVHQGECECYYILCGSGIYNDNGKELPITCGDITFTYSGEGHGISNTSTEEMRFIALTLHE